MEEKRHNKTKEEILSEMETRQKVRRDRQFVREKFFPALCDSTTSIHEADVFLQSFSNMLMETFLGLMKKKSFVDLDLISKLDANSSQYESIKSMVELFNDRTVGDAQALIDGMKDEIRMYFKEEMKGRTLDTLKTKWLEDPHEPQV